jgi:hypothetical protein
MTRGPYNAGRQVGMTNRKYPKESGPALIDAYPGTCVEGLRKTNKNLGQDILRPGRQWNWTPPAQSVVSPAAVRSCSRPGLYTL